MLDGNRRRIVSRTGQIDRLTDVREDVFKKIARRMAGWSMLVLLMLALNVSFHNRVLAHVEKLETTASAEYGFHAFEDHGHHHDEIALAIDRLHGHSHHALDHDHGMMILFPPPAATATRIVLSVLHHEAGRSQRQGPHYGHYRPPRA